MSRPIKNKTHDAVSSTGAGSEVRTKGHSDLGIFVTTSNLDTASDTVKIDLEVSPNRSDWTVPLDSEGNPILQVTTSDFDSNGNAYFSVEGLAIDWFRANLTDFTDDSGSDLTVTIWVFATDWNGPGFAGSSH